MTTLTPTPRGAPGDATSAGLQAPTGTDGSTRSDQREGPAGAGPLWTAAAEVALLGVTLAAVWGLGRLFTGDAYLAPLALIAAASHAAAWAGRRLGLRLASAIALSGAGLLLALAWIVEPHTTSYGLPLEPTWQAAADDFSTAWARFGEVRAPTEPIRGFVAAAAAATWLVGFAADTFAFRFRARFEALLPSFVLFVFGGLLGVDGRRLAAAGFYVGAVLVFVITSGARQRTAGSWLGGRARDGNAALARQGLLMALVALAGAALVGPRLPGAASPALLSWRDATRKPASRITVSPLVDIRTRLVELSGVEAFTVRADVASYWRLTSLDRFDGTIWSSLASYQPVGERLPTDVMSRSRTEAIAQEFEIGALSSIWLPAAYRAEHVGGPSGPSKRETQGPSGPSKRETQGPSGPSKRETQGPEGIRYDRDSSSLLTDDPTSDGLRYSVTSARPQLSADELRLSRSAVPPDVAERNLELPEGLPDRVRSQAREIVEGTDGSYDAAKALQDWFRTSFTYDLDVPPGHDEGAIERFLFVTRRGYCEQFAGAYAAMARAVGLPARVAVGFTPGRQDDAGVFHVTGAEAHAWPEVYLSGIGWVAFEPTPGRAVPGGEGYTGVEPPTAEPSPPATTPPAPGQTPPTTAPSTETQGNETGGGARQDPHGSGGGQGWAVAAGALALVVVLYAVGTSLLARTIRARRRAQAVTAEERILVAWLETEESLTQAGFPRRSSETAGELARRAPAAGPPGALEQLAHDSSAAAFAPGGASGSAALRSESAAAAIRQDLRARAGWRRRALWAVDPRTLPYSSRLKRLRRRLPASPK